MNRLVIFSLVVYVCCSFSHWIDHTIQTGSPDISGAELVTGWHHHLPTMAKDISGWISKI